MARIFDVNDIRNGEVIEIETSLGVCRISRENDDLVFHSSDSGTSMHDEKLILFVCSALQLHKIAVGVPLIIVFKMKPSVNMPTAAKLVVSDIRLLTDVLINDQSEEE